MVGSEEAKPTAHHDDHGSWEKGRRKKEKKATCHSLDLRLSSTLYPRAWRAKPDFVSKKQYVVGFSRSESDTGPNVHRHGIAYGPTLSSCGGLFAS